MRKAVINNVLTLTLSSFIIKILGFVFRIYLSHKIGKEGMGLYQIILSLYALFASVSTLCIGISLSKLVSANEKYGKKILKNALKITLLVSITLSVTVYHKSYDIAIYILQDERAYKCIKIISLAFPAIALFASLTGYFNGLSKVKYPVKGQIVEQTVRIISIFFLLGKIPYLTISKGLIISSCGIVLGEYISAVYLVIKYKNNFKNEKNLYTSKNYYKELFKISVPLFINNLFSSLLHTLFNIMVPELLKSSGFSHKKAIGTLGIVKGMAMPLIFFPTVILSSVATIVLPSVSRAHCFNNKRQINSNIDNSLKISFIISFLILGIYFGYGEIIGKIVYNNIEVGKALKYLSFTAPFIYINITLSAILTGLDKATCITAADIISGIFEIAIIYFLTPRFKFSGYIASLVISEALTTVLYFIFLNKNINIRFDFKNNIFMPLSSLFISMTAGKVFFGELGGIFVSSFLYILILFLTKTLRIADIKS